MAHMFKAVKSARISGWYLELVIDKGHYEVIVYDLDGYPDDYHGVWDSVPVTDDNLNDVLEAWNIWVAEVAKELELNGLQPDWEAQGRYDGSMARSMESILGSLHMRRLFPYGC